MAYLMLPALALFIIDRKWCRALLLCAGAVSLTACMISLISGVLSGDAMGIKDAAFYAGMILIGASPLMRHQSDGVEAESPEAGEDGIVDNRQNSS